MGKRGEVGGWVVPPSRASKRQPMLPHHTASAFPAPTSACLACASSVVTTAAAASALLVLWARAGTTTFRAGLLAGSFRFRGNLKRRADPMTRGLVVSGATVRGLGYGDPNAVYGRNDVAVVAIMMWQTIAKCGRY